MQFAFAPTFILTAGVQLDVFSHIAAGRKTAAEVARAAGASERGVRMLLDALTGFELLTKPDGQYELTPVAAAHLVRSSPDYIGGVMSRGLGMAEAWLNLKDVVRTGQPVRRVNEQEQAEEFFPELVRALHVINREPARRTAEVLGVGSGRAGLQVLDVACGSGVWSIAIAEADPKAHLTAQDFPGVLQHTRQYLKRHGVENRYDFLEGDLKTVDFGQNRFDLAMLGNIVHSEGERASRDLFRRLHRALKPKGRIALADMIPNDERTGPPFPLLFAVNMLAVTSEGDTYTFAEYRQWLHEAGFRKVEAVDIGSHSPLIIATRD